MPRAKGPLPPQHPLHRPPDLGEGDFEGPSRMIREGKAGAYYAGARLGPVAKGGPPRVAPLTAPHGTTP